ncbi:hypothetical protein GCM10009811_32080 [Nostocoides veronense]|uniref:Uncharacterized protein n=1 Tax=Nostocoides veronense TaxID=330836 RepID=A0ABN2M1H6_9MICO
MRLRPSDAAFGRDDPDDRCSDTQQRRSADIKRLSESVVEKRSYGRQEAAACCHCTHLNRSGDNDSEVERKGDEKGKWGLTACPARDITCLCHATSRSAHSPHTLFGDFLIA